MLRQLAPILLFLILVTSRIENVAVVGKAHCVERFSPSLRVEADTIYMCHSAQKREHSHKTTHVCLLQFPIRTHTASFDPDRLEIIDVNTKRGNVLVRGNAPLDRCGKFNPDLILKAIQAKTINRNDLQDEPIVAFDKLIVVSLLNSRFKDEAQVLQEIQRGTKQAASDDSSTTVVEFVHLPVAGSWWSLLPWAARLPLVDATGGASELSTRLHDMLYDDDHDDDGTAPPAGSERHGQTTAIYVHCMRGIDRTGLVAGIFNMRYRNGTTLQEAQQVSWELANRKMQYLEARSLAVGAEKVRLLRGREQAERQSGNAELL